MRSPRSAAGLRQEAAGTPTELGELGGCGQCVGQRLTAQPGQCHSWRQVQKLLCEPLIAFLGRSFGVD